MVHPGRRAKEKFMTPKFEIFEMLDPRPDHRSGRSARLHQLGRSTNNDRTEGKDQRSGEDVRWGGAVRLHKLWLDSGRPHLLGDHR